MSGKYDHLPRAVRRQAEESDALEAQVREAEAAAGEAGVQGGPQPQTTEGQAEAPTPTPTDPASQDAAGTPRGEDDPPLRIDWADEYKSLKTKYDKLEQSYRTLKGKYNAEVHEDVASLKARIEALEGGAGHQSSEGDGGSQPTQTSSDHGLPFTPEKIEQLRDIFGDEHIESLRAIHSDAIAQAKAAIKPYEERVTKQEARNRQNAEDAFFSALDEAHEDWRGINDMEAWYKYLEEVDPNTGEPKGEAVMRANRRWDPTVVIKHLSTFKRRLNKGTQALEAHVVPDDTGRPDPSPQPDKAIYNGDEVAKFYKNFANKKARGVPDSDEDLRLDALYTKAMREGRVSDPSV